MLWLRRGRPTDCLLAKVNPLSVGVDTRLGTSAPFVEGGHPGFSALLKNQAAMRKTLVNDLNNHGIGQRPLKSSDKPCGNASQDASILFTLNCLCICVSTC